MGLHRLLVGFEREGSAFYVSENGMPNAAGYDSFRRSPQHPDEAWHLVWATGDGGPVPPPMDAPTSGFRLAGVRWTEEARGRIAVLVVRSKGPALVRRNAGFPPSAARRLTATVPASFRNTPPSGSTRRSVTR